MRHLPISRLLLIPILCFSAAFALQAMAEEPEKLSEVVVTASRPLRDAGLMRTRFDSIALRENVALSMADVLSFNSSVFVKSYGRNSLSTVAFRGTSPSHTQVLWNSLPMASPMLGMTDFSTIPSYFIDRADMLHGSSSVASVGGGIGGLVEMASAPDAGRGPHLQVVQGVGAFSTFDSFAKFAYGGEKWQTSTRVAFASSENDFEFTNHDKMVNVYDENHHIINRYHPRERNRNGAFRQFNFLQDAYWTPAVGQRLSLNAWYSALHRELPLLSVDYADAADYSNLERDESLRAVLGWRLSCGHSSVSVDAGYVHSHSAYDYSRVGAAGSWMEMTRSRSRVNSFSLVSKWQWIPNNSWLFDVQLRGLQNLVESRDRNRILVADGQYAMGYKAARFELSGSASARWSPTDIIGLGLTLRDELHGSSISPIIPALFADALIWKKASMRLHASASRNLKYPSLGDLFFLPGGNPDLKPERGWCYDAGISSQFSFGCVSLSADASWFDSYISDWIIWLPTVKGFFSPRNVKKVHAYGVETKVGVEASMPKGWLFSFNANYSFTPSINSGAPANEADKSAGRQLPYVPRNSASAVGRISWRGWALDYKWCWYSRRFTMSSADISLSGTLPHYFMNCASLEKELDFGRSSLNFRLAVNNLFNEEYLSVLSRPMPGINAEFFISFSWK